MENRIRNTHIREQDTTHTRTPTHVHFTHQNWMCMFKLAIVVDSPAHTRAHT